MGLRGGGQREERREDARGAGLAELQVEEFAFSSSRSLALSPWESAALLDCSGETKVNLGLGIARCWRKEDSVVVRVEGASFEVPAEVLREHRARRSVLVVEQGGTLYEAEVRGESYYKLVPIEGTAPTVEINGIHMHRVKGVTPIEDAAAKVRASGVRKGERVLEVGTGLGYTAISSLRRGASLVVSVEVDSNVLWLAERNPWSKGLEDSRVHILLGDAAEVARSLRDELFDVIIHDPPRAMDSTAHLYSEGLYVELYRLLRPGGRLFHYTGEPGRAKGLSFPSRVGARLKDVGFEKVRYLSQVMGLIAVKPLRRP